jgi:hypothetical protein
MRLSTFCGLRHDQEQKQSIFFLLEPKQTETQSVSFVFWFVSRNQTILFALFQSVFVFWTCIETTKTNRTFSKQTERISKKSSLSN